MVKFTLSLAAVILSVFVDVALLEFAGRSRNQQGGGRPGFAQVGFGSGKCSATEGVLPDPKTGCCGRHTEVNGDNQDDSNDISGGDQEDGNDVDNGNNNNGYEPDSRDDGNGIGDYDEVDGADFGNDVDNGDGNDFDFGPGNDFDFGPGTDFDFGPGTNFDFGDGNTLDSNDLNGNEMGDFNLDNIFGGNHWQFNEENRFKSVSDKNASDVVPDKYIIAGKATGIAQYPWLVHLNVKVQEMMETKIIGCGGSLISSRHVITAAHCVDFQIGRMEDVSIFLAEYNTRTYPTDCVGRQCVKNVVMHPEKISKHIQYQRGALYNDIAMMKLRGTAPYTDYIRPICLPTFNINNKREGVPLTVTGWGQTEHGQPSTVKMHTQVELVAPSNCKRHYPDLTEGQICAAGRRGQDTCMGDSGGPIMVEHEGTYYIVGLVSGKRADAGCGSPVPTLYTNVFAYRKWIQNFMRY